MEKIEFILNEFNKCDIKLSTEQAEKFVTNKAENLPQDTGLEDWYQSLTDAIPGNA